MKIYWQKLYRRPVFWVAVCAGILYSSWPLSFILNPAVGRHSLASQLDAPGQPFNWVFIGGDVLTGVVLIVAVLLQIRALRDGSKAIKWSVVGYLMFGILAAVAALVPLNCDPQAGTCGALIHNPYVIVHGAASLLSSVALLASVTALNLAAYRRRASRAVRQVSALLLSGWVLFVIGSVIEFFLHVTGNTTQDYFMTLCSASVIAVIGTVEYIHVTKRDQPAAVTGTTPGR